MVREFWFSQFLNLSYLTEFMSGLKHLHPERNVTKDTVNAALLYQLENVVC